MGLLDAPTLTPSAAKKLYAPRSSALTGDAVIKGMGKEAPYAAPLMATPPAVTQGTANTAGLTKQVSYTSSAYLWPGFVDTTGGSATPRGRSTDAGVKASGCESTQVSFDFDGPRFDFKLKASTGTKWRIWVDGLASSATLVPIPSETNATAIILVDLGTSSSGKPRQITVEIESVSSPILFYGVNIAPSDTLVYPRKPGPRVMVVGDSYGHGIGANYYAEGYARSLGRIMGWLDVWHSVTSCPSSGLVKAASVNNGAYITRINYDVIPYAPDVVIIQTSINDYESVGLNLIGPALTAYINALRAALPNVIVVVTSPPYPASSPAAYVQIRDETKAAATALGVPYLDVLARNVFGGTGRSGTPLGDGNADIYRAADGTHPTKEGHWMIANQVAPLLAASLGLEVSDASVPALEARSLAEAAKWPASPKVILTARSGWQAVGTYDAANTNMDDQVDNFLGDRTATITGNGTPAQFFAVQKTGQRINAQGCNVRLWLKVGAVSTLGQLSITLGTDDGSSYWGATLINWVSATDSISNEIKPNEWTMLDIPWSAFTLVAGNPDRKRIEKIQVIGYTKVTGTPTTVKVGGVSFVPDDRPIWPKGVISLSFDDSDISQLVAKRYMDRFGFVGTLFPIIGALDTANSLTTQNVLDFAASGWEIGAHASTSAAHSTGLPAMSHADRMTELDTIKQWQLTNGVWSPTHAYPVGWLDTASAKDVAAVGYNCSRMASGFTLDTPRNPSRFRIRAQNASIGNANLMAQIKRVERDGGWLNIMFHRLVDASPTGNDAFNASLFAICDYAWANDIPIRTIGQVVASARP